jgi:branched-chain amino acid transport system ATP-binding protein
MTALVVEDLEVRFGAVRAVRGLSFAVEPGEIVGLIGPNGAGKTTAFNVITRLYDPDSGEVSFDGESLLRTAPHRVIRRGVARTFQNVELFKTMTVRENVLLGAHARHGARSADDLVDYVGLGGVAQRVVAGLPFGTLKRVELARALA